MTTISKEMQFIIQVQTDILIHSMHSPIGTYGRDRAMAGIFLHDAFRFAPHIPADLDASKAAAQFFEYCLAKDEDFDSLNARFRWIIAANNPGMTT